jgi:2-(1,2-epoxy-1,2-dihydrophenyl)acetyl-CoA isomerase
MTTAETEAGPSVRLRHAGPVSWITLNRPQRLNAFAGTMRDDLHGAVVESSRRPDTRVIVITGAGRAFCAGADVDTMQQLLEAGDDHTFAGLVEAGSRVVASIRSAPQLVVAAVNGVAVGAGASLAVACDLRIASSEAQIGFTFNRIGLHPDWGATYTLPRLVGPGCAAELIYSGRMIDSREAHAIGIWQRVVPADSFAADAAAWAAELAAKPPLALAAAKRSLDRAPGSDLQMMLDIEAAAQLTCFRSNDVREGVAAFREKRQPGFRGT